MNRATGGATLAAAALAFDLGELSPAERNVLELALEGSSVRAMADTLVVSEPTVRSHLGRIYGKLGVRGRVELLARVAEASSRSGGLEVESMARPSDAVRPLGTADSMRETPESVAPILLALFVALLVTLILPLVAVVTVPGLLVAGLLFLRAERGSRERRAAPWVLFAALLAALWVGLASAAFFGVSSPVESEFFPTSLPAESGSR
jgi:DNA-binding CsgD family transcriptional regulator